MHFLDRNNRGKLRGGRFLMTMGPLRRMRGRTARKCPKMALWQKAEGKATVFAVRFFYSGSGETSLPIFWEPEFFGAGNRRDFAHADQVEKRNAQR
jgi:hypothetical protein